MHYVNKDTLKEEHKRQKYGKSTGVDRVSKEEYATNLEENLDCALPEKTDKKRTRKTE